MDKNTLAAFMWKTRQEIHGRYPDDGPIEQQPEMIQDWVTKEADAILKFIAANH